MKKLFLLSFALTNLVFLFSTVASAQQVPDPLPGFVHNIKRDGSLDISNGIILAGSSSGTSSSVVAEIDGNATNGLEVAVVSRDAVLTVISASGNILWQRDLPNRRCATKNVNDLAHSSPAVGDLKGNGVQTLVVGYGGLRTKACGGGIIAFRGTDGKKLWHFNLKRFAKQKKFFAVSHAVYSTPALGNVRGNGKLFVGFGSLDRHVYMLNPRGRLMWYYHTADTVFSSPVFYNVDSTPRLEMIIGSDITRNDYLKPKTKDGGYVYALRTIGNGGKYYGFRDSKAVLWMQAFDQVIQSSPTIADVIPGGSPEIVVGTGCYFPENSSNKRGKWLKILNLADGKVLRTLNTDACLSSSPAIADIDGDGELEIVATINGNSAIGGSGRGKLAAWKADSAEPIWQTEPRTLGQNDSYLGTIQSPVIADLDGNGSLEVVISNAAGIGIFDAATGASYTCEGRTCNVDELVLFATSVLKSTPSIADINQDGKLDLVVAGTNRNANKQAVYAWTNFSDLIFSSPGTHAPYSTPWPQFKKNAERQSVY